MMEEMDQENQGANLLKLKVKKASTAKGRSALQKSSESRYKQFKISREDKRNIYYMKKALESLSAEEQNNLLNVLGIDPQSLIPKTEMEFKKECGSLDAAQTLHRYHQQRLVMNYQKVRDFLHMTSKRQGNGNCLHLSKENSRILQMKMQQQSIQQRPQMGRGGIGDRSNSADFTFDASIQKNFEQL